MQSTLSSLFLPRTSVYAELDNPPNSSQARSNYSLAPDSFPEAEEDQHTPASQVGDPFSPGSATTSPAPARAAALLHPAAAASTLADSRSPFSAEPLDFISLQPASPSARSELGSLQRSPPPSRRSRRSTAASNLSQSGLTAVGSSALGDRSLMGLLGGTRYQPMGFDAGLSEEGVPEEGDEDREDDSLIKPSERRQSAGRADAQSLWVCVCATGIYQVPC